MWEQKEQWQQNHGDHGRHLKHDKDFFVDYKDKAEFKKGGHQEGRQEGHQNGQPKTQEQVEQEHRITRLTTRATFVSFLMWTLVFIAASIGYRATFNKTENRWIRCSFKKSILLLVVASGLGLWKLHMDYKLMKQMRNYHKAENEAMNGKWDGKWNKKEFSMLVEEKDT